MSTCARTKAVMREIGGDGGDSWGDLGLEGRRPRLPLRLSVRTTGKYKINTVRINDTQSNISLEAICTYDWKIQNKQGQNQ